MMAESQDLDFDAVAEVVVAWMHGHGFGDAELTPDAGAGTHDVECSGGIAEINIGAPPSRPNVQRLDQVARSFGRPALYFSVRGFTPSAEEWADNVDIALFAFEKDGTDIVPVNRHAEELASEPPSEEERLLAAASRALATAREELASEQQLRGADEETAERIQQARDMKRMRRNLFG